MQENGNSINLNLSDRLPVHHPDDALWDSIENRLSISYAEEKYYSHLKQLPMHKPESSLWLAIERRLSGSGVKRAIVWTTSIAAGLLIIFGIFSIRNIKEPVKQTSQNTEKSDALNNEILSNTIHSAFSQPKEITFHKAGVIYKAKTGLVSEAAQITDNNHTESLYDTEIKPVVSSANTSSPNDNPIINTESEEVLSNNYNDADNSSHAIQNGDKPVKVTDLNYYPPIDPEIKKTSNRYFSLALDYIPEQIKADEGTAMINSIGLGASYQGDNYKVQSSLGLAYNTALFTYDLAIDQSVKVPVYIAGHGYDTVEYTNTSEFNNLKSKEEHQYFTYNLGAGRKLLSKGKFSVWLNAGAGIAVKLDKNNNLENTVSKIQKFETVGNIDDIETNLPTFSSYYFNVSTGLDFNYKILKRLSLSVAPMTRYYIQPLLENTGENPDKYSFGFTSGLKFKL